MPFTVHDMMTKYYEIQEKDLPFDDDMHKMMDILPYRLIVHDKLLQDREQLSMRVIDASDNIFTFVVLHEPTQFKFTFQSFPDRNDTIILTAKTYRPKRSSWTPVVLLA